LLLVRTPCPYASSNRLKDRPSRSPPDVDDVVAKRGRGRRSDGLVLLGDGWITNKDGKRSRRPACEPASQPDCRLNWLGRSNRFANSTSLFGSRLVARETRFVEPRLVCEVEFTEWTSRSRELRHPSFKGLRWDKAAQEVMREEP
jgi:ATP dependent DNA ligase C terminal region